MNTNVESSKCRGLQKTCPHTVEIIRDIRLYNTDFSPSTKLSVLSAVICSTLTEDKVPFSGLCSSLCLALTFFGLTEKTGEVKLKLK